MADATPNTSDRPEAPSTRTRPHDGPFSGALGIFVFVVLFGAAGFLTYRTLFNPPPSRPIPRPSDFVCVETQKHFTHNMVEGERAPVRSPYNGKETGYPAEKCFWTRDGKRKNEPTFVVLSYYLGKSGDTICPDCGRIVVGHNPEPPPETPLAPEASTPASTDPATTRPSD